MSVQKMSLVRKAPVNDPGRVAKKDEVNAKPRKKSKAMDINARDNAEDRVWGVHTRARSEATNLAELLVDSQNVERSLRGEELQENPHASADENDGEGEGDEGRDAAVASAKKLKMEELRAALDEAEIEYDEKAKKDELVELYVDNGLGEEAEEE